MIHPTTGNLFDAPAEALVNPTNCVGVMGRGLALNFPTKRHWRSKSRLEDIEAGLTDLVRVIHELQIRSMAIPALGAGLGGLDWQPVRELITTALTLEDCDVFLYGPRD